MIPSQPCGHATPGGVRAVVKFVKDLVDEMGADVGIDWHGHRDRGLGVINSAPASGGNFSGIFSIKLSLDNGCKQALTLTCKPAAAAFSSPRRKSGGPPCAL